MAPITLTPTDMREGYMPPEAMAEAAKMQEQKEARERADLERLTQQGVDDALEGIREKFERNPDERERLPFHGTKHTEGVVDRASQVLNAIRSGAPELVSDRTIAIGRFAAAHHDTVQEWEPNVVTEAEGTKELRRRFAARNEQASADLAIARMDQIDRMRNDAGEPAIFTDADRRTMREAIDATIPGWDPSVGTVNQPRLSPESSVIARAVALADLGESGTDPEGYLAGGDALFREENLDVLADAKDPSKVSTERKEYLRKRMLNWSRSQPGFAAGRKALLEKELGELPEAARAEVRKLFSRFDDSIDAANDVAERRANMTLEELLKDMGYEDAQPSSGELAPLDKAG